MKYNDGASGEPLYQFVATDVSDDILKQISNYVSNNPMHGYHTHIHYSVNGENERFSCHNFNKDEVGKWLGYLTTRSGIPCIRFRKYQHTDYPSIQGVWTPFTHQAPELNSAEFPHVSVLLQLEFNLTIKNEVINILSLGGTF